MTRRKRRVISLLAALVIVVGGFGVYSFLEEEKVASIVTLDVNPSIELRVDSDEDIIEVKALNSDAEKVLQGMKLKGADVDTAVNANGNFDCYVFNAPMAKYLSVTALFQDPRRLME